MTFNHKFHKFQAKDKITLNGKLFEWESTIVHRKDPNQLHLFRKPNFRIRPGTPLTIIGLAKRHCYTVIADGHPTRHLYHEQFLERL
jgi:hypothetical protein